MLPETETVLCVVSRSVMWQMVGRLIWRTLRQLVSLTVVNEPLRQSTLRVNCIQMWCLQLLLPVTLKLNFVRTKLFRFAKLWYELRSYIHFNLYIYRSCIVSKYFRLITACSYIYILFIIIEYNLIVLS